MNKHDVLIAYISIISIRYKFVFVLFVLISLISIFVLCNVFHNNYYFCLYTYYIHYHAMWGWKLRTCEKKTVFLLSISWQSIDRILHVMILVGRVGTRQSSSWALWQMQHWRLIFMSFTSQMGWSYRPIQFILSIWIERKSKNTCCVHIYFFYFPGLFALLMASNIRWTHFSHLKLLLALYVL